MGILLPCSSAQSYWLQGWLVLVREMKPLHLCEAKVFKVGRLIAQFGRFNNEHVHGHGQLHDFVIHNSWHANTLDDAICAILAAAVLEEGLLEELYHVVCAPSLTI